MLIIHLSSSSSSTLMGPPLYQALALRCPFIQLNSISKIIHAKVAMIDIIRAPL